VSQRVETDCTSEPEPCQREGSDNSCNRSSHCATLAAVLDGESVLRIALLARGDGWHVYSTPLRPARPLRGRCLRPTARPAQGDRPGRGRAGVHHLHQRATGPDGADAGNDKGRSGKDQRRWRCPYREVYLNLNLSEQGSQEKALPAALGRARQLLNEG